MMKEYQTDRSMDAVSNVMQSSSEDDISLAQGTLQCPLCVFTTSNRSKFTEHLINYCTSTKRKDSIFKANLSQLPALKYLEDDEKCSHTTREEYTAHKTEEIDKFGLDVSRVNSQSSIKKQEGRGFRENKSCKQCSFVTNTKMEYWEHMRCHIKGFTCSACSFVTKYKHHMNHHWLSVHDGSKPFKCKECSYTCVSKSMLTSHLKKHSNVYPYRCANCTYKTKFCNALKKHLRKKEHQPAVVLNADGSPNPLFIIDVYGTKRGPKQKLSVTGEQDELNEHKMNDSQLGSAISSPVLSLRSPVVRYLTVTTMNGINDANWVKNGENQNHQSVVKFPYGDLVAAFNLSNHLSLHEDAFNENMQKICDRAQSDTLMGYAEMTNVENVRMTETFVQNPPVTFFDTSEHCIFDKDAKVSISEPSVLVALKAPQLETQKNEFMALDTPLDLRIAEAMRKNQLQFQLLAKNLPKTTGTNKRKGRAIKLERRMVKEDAEDKWNQIEFDGELSAIGKTSVQNENVQKMKGTEDKAIADSVDTEFICHYCEIMFGNVVMYTVHMSCHGFDDPFACNMCGHQCTDNLSFFLHIARSEHM